MKLVLLVEWYGFEHHPPQCLIVEGFQGNKMLHDIWWQTFEGRQRCLRRCYEQFLDRLLCRLCYALHRLQDIVRQGQRNRLRHILSLYNFFSTRQPQPATDQLLLPHGQSRSSCDGNRRTLGNHYAISGW